jgi:carboxyl-terminal processing protease
MRTNIRGRKLAATALLTCLCAPLSPAADDPAVEMARELKKIVEVFATVERESAEPVSAETAFFQGAIPGMLRPLDPHSLFFDPGQFEQLQQLERSEQKGFGTIVSILPGRVIVLQAMPGTPSAKAGLSPGDEVLAINHIELARLQFEQLVQLLGEARRQEVTLDVRRPGASGLLKITMSPALVDSPTVDRAFLVAPRVAYLRITEFEGPTSRLVQQTIEKLGGEYLRGLILDLRDNPGGVVQSALETAALFLSPDQVVFSIRGRTSQPEEVRVPRLATPYTFPVAVLMNAKSASASEIVAGALQDHDRAIILGEPSFGKGLVQAVFPLSAASGLALTTAFYYTPSGRSIQKPLHGGQLDTATTAKQGLFRTDSGRPVQGGGGIQPDEAVLPDPQTGLQMVIDATGVLTSFAGEYLRTREAGEDFEVPPGLLDDLKLFLADRRIQPSVTDWSRDREWIASRLKQEIFNLKLGVAKGDEVEMQRDAVVRAALRKLRGAP